MALLEQELAQAILVHDLATSIQVSSSVRITIASLGLSLSSRVATLILVQLGLAEGLSEGIPLPLLLEGVTLLLELVLWALPGLAPSALSRGPRWCTTWVIGSTERLPCTAHRASSRSTVL